MNIQNLLQGVHGPKLEALPWTTKLETFGVENQVPPGMRFSTVWFRAVSFLIATLHEPSTESDRLAHHLLRMAVVFSHLLVFFFKEAPVFTFKII